MPPTTEVPVLGEVSFARQVWNFTSAAATFISDGMHFVDKDTYAARLAVCDTCDRRSGNRCAECGCSLTLKASGRVFQCPLGKWDNVQSQKSDGQPS